jgi:hypothetical protein
VMLHHVFAVSGTSKQMLPSTFCLHTECFQINKSISWNQMSKRKKAGPI